MNGTGSLPQSKEVKGKQVNIRLSKTMEDQVFERIKELGFSTKAEYIRFLVVADVQKPKARK